MCGIFGITRSARSSARADFIKQAFENLCLLSESRGSDASGVAISNTRSIQLLKRPWAASKLIKNSLFQKTLGHALFDNQDTPLALIGHTRLVTNGSAHHHANNQPVFSGEIVGVHNGIIVNNLELWEKHGPGARISEVDSEVILYLLRKFWEKSHSLPAATCQTFSELRGAASIAALFGTSNTMLLATNNGSLYVMKTALEGTWIFASERYILRSLVAKMPRAELDPASITQVKPGSGICVGYANASFEPFSFEALAPNIDKNGSIPKLNLAQREVIDLDPPREASASEVEQKQRVRELAVWASEQYKYDPSFAEALRRCARCILPESMPFIEFDGDGICNFCREQQRLAPSAAGKLEQLADRIRSADGSADCLVGISGGRDSCYGLHYLKRVVGLNPIAFTYDWGIVTDLARRNISRLCGSLGVEHIVVSAEISRKRRNIGANVEAWLKKPELGMVPLFMAGDKAYFYHARRLKRELGVQTTFLCENLLERTNFKTGFAGVPPYHADQRHVYTLPLSGKLRLAHYYLRTMLLNPAYLNRSLLDTLIGFACYYLIKRDYENLFAYIPWSEEKIIATLRGEYNWELACDTECTWRIGDGTAAFYNLIYFNAAGFTENDAFRSNQVREGVLSRGEALARVLKENQPRYYTLAWYCVTIGIDFKKTLEIVHSLRLKPVVL